MKEWPTCLGLLISFKLVLPHHVVLFRFRILSVTALENSTERYGFGGYARSTPFLRQPTTLDENVFREAVCWH
uniref:Putative secreted protein n=1 Tax=Ixodes ricinus TaxID=34613 RepID=A0A6B0TSS6_IXORI